MATKKKAPKKKRGEYDEPLQVNASFSDIIKAAAKHSDLNSEKKRKSKAKKKD